MGRGIEDEGMGFRTGAIYAQAVEKRLVGVVPKGFFLPLFR